MRLSVPEGYDTFLFTYFELFIFQSESVNLLSSRTQFSS